MFIEVYHKIKKEGDNIKGEGLLWLNKDHVRNFVVSKNKTYAVMKDRRTIKIFVADKSIDVNYEALVRQALFPAPMQEKPVKKGFRQRKKAK